ncbi:hypothetical protein [Neorhodopirellula lusitana]|uniref:hypothetical protein n=1 Tax=Neorhodopirellula lusitana TaxID=445327 RepID=UPI00384ECF77
MNKADAIREVAKNHLHLTNNQIKQELRRQGVVVSSSFIVNVLGSHKKRLALSSYSIDLRKKAQEFLALAGDDYDLARNLLALAATNQD